MSFVTSVNSIIENANPTQISNSTQVIVANSKMLARGGMKTTDKVSTNEKIVAAHRYLFCFFKVNTEWRIERTSNACTVSVNANVKNAIVDAYS